MKISFLQLMYLCLFVNYSTARELNYNQSYMHNKDTLIEVNVKEINSVNPLMVLKCKDFTLTGTGSNAAWEKANWNTLTKLDTGGRGYESKYKILYSTAGIYLLFYGEDDKITTKAYNDFEDIYNGDVFEVFFHPNPLQPVYFEYEINQMSKELILSLSKSSNIITSWMPWKYENKKDQAIKKMVHVAGGNTEVNGVIKWWTAELFFPYTLLGLLPSVPPVSGTVWNANFCRLDYDSGKIIKWSWSPTIKNSFHELDKFRSIKFE